MGLPEIDCQFSKFKSEKQNSSLELDTDYMRTGSSVEAHE